VFTHSLDGQLDKKMEDVIDKSLNLYSTVSEISDTYMPIIEPSGAKQGSSMLKCCVSVC
jgi:hypothetical protein